MAGVVFDAVAIAHLLEHLQVVGGALLQPLGLQQAPFPVEQVKAVMQLTANFGNRPLQTLLRGHKVLGGVDVDRVEALQDLAGGGFDIANRFDLIAKQFNPHQAILIGRSDFKHIATHPETAPRDFQIVAGILVINKFPQGAPQVQGFTHLELHRRLKVFRGNAQAVDAADRGNNDHIGALKQRARGRVA